MNNTALFLLFPLPSNINPKNKVPTKGSWWTNKRILKKKIKQKRRCSWKCHKDWCYPNKKILFSKNILHCIAKSFDRLCCKACERKKLPIELRQMLTLTPICDVNLTHRELRNCFSLHLPPTTSSLSFVKKKKKEWKLRWYSYKKILILKYTTWLCLYDSNEVGQEKLICSQPHASYVYSQLVEEQNQNTTKYFHGIQ